MSEFSKDQKKQLESAMNLEPSPIPTHAITNGERFPTVRQTLAQKKVEAKLNEIADKYAPAQGLTRREFLKTPCGFAAAFMAMNAVFGPVFAVTEEEVSDPMAAMNSPSNQLLKQSFIFDLHSHSHENPPDGSPSAKTDLNFRGFQELLGRAINNLGPDYGFFVAEGGPVDSALGSYSKERYIKEMFFDSDTKMCMLFGLHGAKGDGSADLLPNQLARELADEINECAGTTRVITASTFNPRRDVDGVSALDAFKYAIENLRPASMKGWSVGDPLVGSAADVIEAKGWALNDFELMQPFYDVMNTHPKSPKNFNIHKGALGLNYHALDSTNEDEAMYMQMFNAPRGQAWGFATVDDVGPAAQANPDLNFIVIHCGLSALGAFDSDGEYGNDGEQWLNNLYKKHYVSPNDTRSPQTPRGILDWVVGGTILDSMGGVTTEQTSLVDIPTAFNVNNVYIELSTTFAHCVVADPKFTAALIGIMAEGLGPDKILWASDSLLYGSPQWQLEAFARLRIYDLFNDIFDEDLKHILKMPEHVFKRHVLGLNAARGPFNKHLPKNFSSTKSTKGEGIGECFDDEMAGATLNDYFDNDKVGQLKAKYAGLDGNHRSNQAYGLVLKEKKA